MSLFDFSEAELNPGEKHPKSIGIVQSVDNGRVFIQISSGEKLQLLRIGSLVAIPGGVGRYIIGHTSRIWRHQPKVEKVQAEVEADEVKDIFASIPENNGALLNLLGCIRDRADGPRFSRSMDDLPGIDEEVFLLADKNLHDFMNVVSASSKTAQTTPLHFGQFSLDTTASAYLDGNKLFQRHAALLGSTGSGKSWAVARILEQANQLPDTNIVLFDLHGEYKNLPYAKQFKIAGPPDLAVPSEDVLFLPYWLLSYDEIQAIFIEKSEFTAQNQSLVIHNAVKELKKAHLENENKTHVLEQFTINSPVPFDIMVLLAQLNELNEQMVPGATAGKDKQGPYFGQFNRLIPRIEGKITDRRYGFMFQAPPEWHAYEALHALAKTLLGFGKTGDVSNGIKIIDLSEVPIDVLPVVVGTLARLIYSLQFWTPAENRHPILIACDEAHLYLPKAQNANPLERAAVESVERIAKEGRKYGVGLMVISQRPSDVSETILSQCNNVISLRLTNPSDQNTVRKLLPDSLGDIMQMLPLMDVGEAVVVGDAVLLPARIRVEAPKAKPLSATIDFWDEWGKSDPRENALFAIISENLRRQERLDKL
jgi:DNA helicase HerA-like ATPase